MANPTAKPIPLAEVNTRFRNRCSGMTGSAACLLRLLTHCCGIGLGSRHAHLSPAPAAAPHAARRPASGGAAPGGRPSVRTGRLGRGGAVPGTVTADRSSAVPAPCQDRAVLAAAGPGRTSRGRGMVRVGRHRAEDRVRLVSATRHLALPAPGHHDHPPGRGRGVRRLHAARLAGPRGLDQRPDPPVRQVVRDLLLRARHGRAGGLSPAGPGRGGTGTMAHHHPRVLPAGPGPGHGTALAHMLRADAHTAADGPDNNGTAGPVASRSPAWSAEDRAGPVRDQAAGQPTSGSGPPARTRTVSRGSTTPPTEPGTPTATEISQARLIASRLTAAGKPVSRRALRSEGIKGSNQALNVLARRINAELADAAHIRPRLRTLRCDPEPSGGCFTTRGWPRPVASFIAMPSAGA
jgi:hypothetical protein